MFAAAAGTMLLAACQDNPAAPSQDRIIAGSPQTLQSLATGVIAQNRAEVGSGLPIVVPDIMARDAIVLTNSEPRYTSEFYESQPDPYDFIGGSSWDGNYMTLRAIHSLFQSPAYTELMDTVEQHAVAGVMRNIALIAYLRVVEMHDQNGMVIQPDDPTALGPLKTKAAALTYLSALADTAIADLSAAGTTVPFTLPSGYSLHGDYGTIANQLRLAHALKGRIELYRALSDPANPSTANATTAITELTTALDDAPGTVTQEYLNKGPWYEFNPAAPETEPNPLVAASFYVTDNFASSINALDARKANIIPTGAASANGYSAHNIWASTNPSVATNKSLPLPIMRNAQVYLLRAQAEVLANDLPAATADVNVVHRIEGGLPAYLTFLNANAAIDAILYEYRYSFIYQGPEHLVALRQYSKINTAYVAQLGMPSPGANDALVQQLPIPGNEAAARGGNITPTP
jgi:hypothetical protein